MDVPRHVIRRRTPDDDVVSTGSAGRALGMSRQGVAKAMKAGRIPGFQDPTNGRWWVERPYVVRQAERARGLDTNDRVTALEVQVAALAALVKQTPTGRTESRSDGDEVRRLREEFVASHAVNAELNAASSLADGSNQLRQKAVAAMSEAIGHLQHLAGDQTEEIQHLRQAIAQTQIPASPADLTE